jgi:hypothetical protein
LSYEDLVLPVMLKEAVIENIPYPHFVGYNFVFVLRWVKEVMRVVLDRREEFR